MDTTNSKKIYIIMNKPCGYVCSAVSDSHKTVYELLPPELQTLVKNAKRGERLHTVGRLDCNTSGLLLLTNDGDFSNRLTRPENHIPKTYEVTLAQPLDKQTFCEYSNILAQGIKLPPEKKAPEQICSGAKLEYVSPVSCRITITEGKFHEVRRIFKALGNEVTELERVAIGALELPKSLSCGQYVLTTREKVAP